MIIIGTGDSFIARNLPEQDQASAELRQWFQQADVRFTNLEITTHKGGASPAPFSGGTWAMADPSVLDDLKAYGFNLVNWANNHTMDYLYQGLCATESALNQRRIVHAGAGQTLAAASEARYLETVNGRVALIGVTSTFHPSWIAGNATPHLPGRPGVNALRFKEINYVTASELQALKRISEKTNMDAAERLNQMEGFSLSGSNGDFLFAGKQFRLGSTTCQVRVAVEEDLTRIIRSIDAAKRQADYVIVSFHSHEMSQMNKALPADFMQKASRAFIDAGADCIFGHGPHVVRGIELYQEKPIFYSLGNFIFQNDSVSHLPLDFYEKYGLTGEASSADGFDVRSDNGKKGLGANQAVWKSVIPKLYWKNGVLQRIELQPIDLGYDLPRYRKGWPKLTSDTHVLEQMIRLSKPFGTDLTLTQGMAIWERK